MKIPGYVFLSKWRVALACGAIYFHHLGIIRISSFLFVGTVERYGVSRNLASVPFVLRAAITQLIGPITGYLACKFRLNRLIMLGCFLSSLGMALCFFAEDIYTVILCWGVLSGFGNGLINMVTISVNCHYKNDGTVANGISLAGASIGGIVYTVICEPLFHEYKLSGTFLLISAIALHSVPAVMLLTDSGSRTKISNRKNYLKKESVMSVGALQQQSTLQRNIERTKEGLDNDKIYKYSTSDSTIAFSIEGLIEPSKSEWVETKYNPKVDSYDCSMSLTNSSQEFSASILKNLNSEDLEDVLQSDKLKDSRPGHIKSIQKEDRINEIPPTLRNEPVEYQITNSKNIPCTPPICKKETNILETIRVFVDPIFLLIAFAQSSFLGLLILITTTIGDYVIDKGFTLKEATIVIAVGAVSDLIGRISLGWVTDRGFMSLSNFTTILYLVCGSSFFALTLSSDMHGLTITYLVISYAIGNLQPLFPTMISQNFDGDMKIMALSSRFLLFLPISFIISPLIGYFRENLGSYVGLYCSMAGFCGMCALLFLFMSKIQKYRSIKTNA